MIELKNISKTFDSDEGGVDALKDVSLTIADGDIYGIIGMSGAGKSTLVRCINLLERPGSGDVVVNGQSLCDMTPAQLRLARRKITMIFQHFNLLAQRTCLKNVCFPMELAGVPRAEAEKRAGELLSLVGLPDKANAYPAQLSGGQQQRVAIARALATEPEVLLCDEATSALDPKTTRQILELIRDINAKLGITVVIITHQMSVVKEICTHVAILDEGRIAEEGLVAAVFAAPASAAAHILGQPHDGYPPRRQARLRGGHTLQCHFRNHAKALRGGLRQYALGHPRRSVRAGAEISLRHRKRTGGGGNPQCMTICFPKAPFRIF